MTSFNSQLLLDETKMQLLRSDIMLDDQPGTSNGCGISPSKKKRSFIESQSKLNYYLII